MGKGTAFWEWFLFPDAVQGAELYFTVGSADRKLVVERGGEHKVGHRQRALLGEQFDRGLAAITAVKKNLDFCITDCI